MIADDIKIILTGYGYKVLDTDEALIQFCKGAVEQNIMNIDNIDEIPTALNYVVAKRRAGEFLYMKFGKDKSVADANNIEAPAREIKEGDTTVSLDIGNGTRIQITTLNELRRYGSDDILGFRKMRW